MLNNSAAAGAAGAGANSVANPAPETSPDPLIPLLQRLTAQMSVTEFAFTASTPLIGGLIRAVRQWWGNVAARWMLRHYAGQQLEYQRTLVQLLQHLVRDNQLTRAQLAEAQGQLQQAQTELAQVARQLAAETARGHARAQLFEHDISTLTQIVLKPDPASDQQMSKPSGLNGPDPALT